MICTSTKWYWDYKSKKDEMLGACSMHFRDEKCIQTLVRKLRHMEDHSVDGSWMQRNYFLLN